MRRKLKEGKGREKNWRGSVERTGEKERERSKGKGRWWEEKQEFFRLRRLVAEGEEERNGGKEIEYKEIERIDKEMQKNEKWQKIVDLKYNKRY